MLLPGNPLSPAFQSGQGPSRGRRVETRCVLGEEQGKAKLDTEDGVEAEGRGERP